MGTSGKLKKMKKMILVRDDGRETKDVRIPGGGGGSEGVLNDPKGPRP